MSVSQGNYTITEVGVINNTKLQAQYQNKKTEIHNKNIRYNLRNQAEQWGFHGTSKESIKSISTGGFLHPEYLRNQLGVRLLDKGYYGFGIYFTEYSDYA